jgi:hypothetical protein
VDLPSRDPLLNGPRAAVPAPRTSPETAAPETAAPDQLRSNPVRWRVIDRLALVGHRHAGHLLDRHGTPAVPARHAVTFLFAQPARGTDDGLRIASRMFLHGDDVDDLTAVLHALADRAADYRRAHYSPLPRIIDRHEPMNREARYLATATSSLEPADDPAEPRSWRGLAHVVDGTQLVLQKRVDPGVILFDPGELAVATTHTLAVHTLQEPFGFQRMWRYLEESDLAADPDLVGALTALGQLHALITDSEQRYRHHRRKP